MHTREEVGTILAEYASEKLTIQTSFRNISHSVLDGPDDTIHE